MIDAESEPGSREPESDTPPEKPASPGPEPTAQAPAPEDTYAVMLTATGGLVPGQVVLGSWGDVNDMLLAGMARAAIPIEIARAGIFIFALPEA